MQLTRAILSSVRNWSTWWLVSNTRILSTPIRINSYWRTSIVPVYGSGIDSNWPARWSSILFIFNTLTRIQLSITGIIEISSMFNSKSKEMNSCSSFLLDIGAYPLADDFDPWNCGSWWEVTGYPVYRPTFEITCN